MCLVLDCHVATVKERGFLPRGAANNETDFNRSLLAHLPTSVFESIVLKDISVTPMNREFSSFRLIVYPFFNTHGFPVFANYDYPFRERNIVGFDNKSIVYAQRD